jgi:tRNA threonylcarbamoyladenosine biosynthesis protein TsaE
MKHTYVTDSDEQTIAVGRELAKLFRPPCLVLLRGELGSGKTTLVKGIVEGFEAANKEDVTSPTFTLVHEYLGPRAAVFHVDVYRIDSQLELETLALDDLRDHKSVVLVEWGEKFQRLRQEADAVIEIIPTGEHNRAITVTDGARSQVGH